MNKAPKEHNALDPEMIGKFWDAINWEEVEIRIIQDGMETLHKHARSREEFVGLCISGSSKGYNVYIGIHRRTSKGTKNYQVNGMKFLHADLDKATPAHAKAFEDKIKDILQYSHKVQTSSDGYHYFFPIPALDDNKKIRELLSKARAFFLNMSVVADSSVYNPSRVLRCWGTRNKKPDKNNELVEILEEHQADAKKNMNNFLKYCEENNIQGEIIKDIDYSDRPKDLLTELIREVVDISALIEEYGSDISINPTTCILGHSSQSGRNLAYDDNKGVFYCHHAGCGAKGDMFSLVMLKENISFIEARKKLLHRPEVQKEIKIRHPEFDYIYLPQMGHTTATNFCDDVTRKLEFQEELFYRQATDSFVEIVNKKIATITPARMVTILELWGKPCMLNWDTKLKNFVPVEKPATESNCKILMNYADLKETIPKISKVIYSPIPFLTKDKQLIFPKRGYNPELELFMSHDAPEIDDTISLKEAKKALLDLHSEFCFKEKEDIFRALASFITPMLRGVYSKWNIRSIVFFYFANAQRAGKDYCAKLRQLLYLGYDFEDVPISHGEKSHNTSDELRKKLVGDVKFGKNFYHSANNKGRIDNATIEQFSTASKVMDRILGSNTTIEYDNDFEISLSGNMGVQLTPDFNARTMKINLHLRVEDPNKRKFKRPDLHGFLLSNRAYYLSCVYSLIKNWYDKGMPKGSEPFTSFPEWASILGGIFEAAGWENPIKNNFDVTNLDDELLDMKSAFEIAYEKYGEKDILRADFRNIVHSSNNELFTDLNFDEKSGQTKFSLLINKFIGRTLSNITLIADDNKKTARQKLKFTKNKQKTTKFDEYFTEGGNVVT